MLWGDEEDEVRDLGEGEEIEPWKAWLCIATCLAIVGMSLWLG